jgi:hypothetical protein
MRSLSRLRSTPLAPLPRSGRGKQNPYEHRLRNGSTTVQRSEKSAFICVHARPFPPCSPWFMSVAACLDERMASLLHSR